MEVGFYWKPQTLILATSPQSPLSSSGSLFVPSDFRTGKFVVRPQRRTCRRSWSGSGYQTRSCRFLVRASVYGRNILAVVAFAVANFAAIRLFYVNYVRSNRGSSKVSGPSGYDVLEDHHCSEEGGPPLKQIHVTSKVEDPENLHQETSIMEGENVHEDAVNCSLFNVEDKLLTSQSSLVKFEIDITAKLSQEPASEVLAASFNDKVTKEAEINNVVALPSAMPEAREKSGIRTEVLNNMAQTAFEEACIDIDQDGGVSNKLVQVEPEVSSFNGLSKYVKEDISSFYEEKQSELRTISPFEGGSNVSHNTTLQENYSISPLLMPNNMNGAEDFRKEFSPAKEYHEGNVCSALFKYASASKRRDALKNASLSKGKRLVLRPAERATSRSTRPNDTAAKEKSGPSEYLTTYNHLLRTGRLTDCIDLLESMERKGLLDMDKVYHARFFNACKSKKAVKEAFSFTKLIKKPTLSTFNMLLSVCASSRNSEGPFEVLRLVKEAGLKADCKLYTTLISTCAKTGKVDTMFEFTF